MEDVRKSRSMPATLALATIARQFGGSRIERQVLAQAFDLVWQVEREAVSRIPSAAAGDEGALVTERLAQVGASRNGSRRRVEEMAGVGSAEGGVP